MIYYEGDITVIMHDAISDITGKGTIYKTITTNIKHNNNPENQEVVFYTVILNGR